MEKRIELLNGIPNLKAGLIYPHQFSFLFIPFTQIHQYLTALPTDNPQTFLQPNLILSSPL